MCHSGVAQFKTPLLDPAGEPHSQRVNPSLVTLCILLKLYEPETTETLYKLLVLQPRFEIYDIEIVFCMIKETWDKAGLPSITPTVTPEGRLWSLWLALPLILRGLRVLG
ncbi:hypothetical protein M231_07354 [Tremella mesenterica]|uniref:Uncharacterized protein n=1 Tax=Tremella mesenterica TaxID=5217 RepID=A0A4Q1BFU6_TREME|nr:hypothetical protein M231_07354 [Tremella mesenterica]